MHHLTGKLVIRHPQVFNSEMEAITRWLCSFKADNVRVKPHNETVTCGDNELNLLTPNISTYCAKFALGQLCMRIYLTLILYQNQNIIIHISHNLSCASPDGQINDSTLIICFDRSKIWQNEGLCSFMYGPVSI